MRRLVSLLLLLPACRPTSTSPEATESLGAPQPAVESPAVAASPDPAPAEPTSPPPSSPPPTEPVLVVTEPPTLDALQELSFGEVVLGHPAPTTAALSKDPAFRSITAVIAADLRHDAEVDPKAGVGTHHPHRQFDRRWLSRDNVRVELVALVNRFDRRPFASEHCGETRLIYRLAYDATVKGVEVHSRLPMTFNVVLWQDGDDCGQVAQRWMAPPDQDPQTRAAWLQSEEGPLADLRLSTEHLKAVEVNLQSVRWPSAVRPGMGGHAEYLLRVFHRDGDRFVPAPLENTPNVARLRKSQRLRAELLDWIRDPANVTRLDQGIATLPEKFLAKRGVSVTPRALARLSNRPFSALVSEQQLADIDYSALTHVKSPAAMLRRLDGLSCGGCHESRSVAGFHLLGEDHPDQQLDAIAVSLSPHLLGDLERRERYLHALLRDQPADDSRPLSETDAVPGGYGAHCGRGDPGFASWTCQPGLECQPTTDSLLGACVTAGTPGSGDPCELGTMNEHPDPHRDSVHHAQRRTCDDAAVCNGNAVGFPGGMCTSGCAGLDEGEACGTIVSLRPFNLCIGMHRPFPECIAKNAHPAGMRACDRDHACLDDYICARSPHDDPANEGGACLPPYFLFQLRVDGHVMGT